MSYDPMKALQAAGVFDVDLPPSLKKAMAGLSQDEVDIIVAAKSEAPQKPAPWTPPNVQQMQGDVAMGCACGLWTGSGAGAMK